ncbi:LysR family transcriptional regulator [Roseibium porphyridii]|uniref:LysR family transcriptional regulator n=1 Tax=Roseibium porphyridii TaxID=2866279 RepID=A0ABY8EXU9_9HYPH|nr:MULTISPECIES: LysR family transcriptional regulator [Stappiaceae]QFT32561.1 Glycine cleavage system transcriptional activator [Labrenzia sp. THAF82]WFE87892.1 LysR family transcriptional regulator [Roseibium sp. KMA01]
MDWRSLPPLNALKAFTAVAERKSLSAAGRDLNVTHAAISQQVRSLETFMGQQLVVREGRGIALTPEGELLFNGLKRGFEAIQETVDELLEDDAARPLHITTTPSFAVSWLMPRINDFRLKHPEIELMLNPTPEVVELTPGGADLAIRYGDGDWPGIEAELFMETHFAVVGASCLVKDRKIEKPEDILDFPWLQEYGSNELKLWLEKQGKVPCGRLNVTHMPGYMVLEGLRRGDGISAVATAFVEPDLETGNLVILIEGSIYEGTGYYMATRPGVKRPPLKAFMSWLRTMRAEQEHQSKSIC